MCVVLFMMCRCVLMFFCLLVFLFLPFFFETQRLRRELARNSMSYSPLPTNPFARPTTAPGAATPEQGMLGMFGQGAFEIPRLRVAGNTPVFIHWSVVILFGFFVFACWGWSSYLEVESRIFVTLISPVLFLLTIFLHELGHAYSYYKVVCLCWLNFFYFFYCCYRFMECG
jgi:hypothetical protein